MDYKKFLKSINHLLTRLYIKAIEHKWQGRLRYIYKNNHADKLVIVFSGFSPKRPVYNYKRALQNVKHINQLYILDDFGYRGSYYWLEDGKDTPLTLTNGLICHIIGEGRFKEVYTMGSSKGGTCAIYFGLEFSVKGVYAGACQYFVGNYLNSDNNKLILKAMLGDGYTQDVFDKLNNMLRDQLQCHKGSSTVVNLLYSKHEHTYPEHIAYLIQDLQKYMIPFTEQIEEFEDHSEVGRFFKPYIQKAFLNLS